MSVENVYEHFYRTPRVGAEKLSDRGGPFGFDITAALEIDYLIDAFRCDAIIETGCHLGDTTTYLASAYERITIITCDIVEDYVDYVKQRIGEAPHVIVELGDSPAVVAKYKDQFRCPLFFLDAHWYDHWPLEHEMRLIENGVVCIDDFDIGHPRFGFDEYKGVRCGPELIKRFGDKINTYYTNNPNEFYAYPCLQPGRRSGHGYYQIGQPIDYFKFCKYFLAHSVINPDPEMRGSVRL